MQSPAPQSGTRRTGWKKILGRTIAAYFLFETISGLAVTLGPFRPAIEWGLLLHTAVGFLCIAPLVWYFVQHWKDYSDQTLSDVLLLGYVGLGALSICLLTAIWVSCQAIFGIHTSPVLRYVHLVSSLLAVGASVPHIVIAWWRRRNSSFVEGAAGWARFSVGVAVVGAFLVVPLTLAYSGTKYRHEFPQDYSYPFGKDRPFAPSLAHTGTNGALDARSISGSASCGASGCHAEIYREWKTSAHRYAAMDPIFQGIQTVMAKQNGPESTRYCGGCHDPISLFSGSKNLYADSLTGSAGYEEGISCLACHSIQKTDIQGNANYTISQPFEYLWEWSPDHSLGSFARNFLIRSWPAQHNRLSKRMYKKPEYCAACHKQFIDQEVNRVGWVQLQNQYDNWAASHWNHKGDPRNTVECRECHMPLIDSHDPAAGDTNDYNRSADDHKHRSHRFIAANNFVPELLHLEGAPEHLALTQHWLQGQFDVPEIRGKWAEGPIVKVRVEAPQTIPPGKRLPVRVILTSNKVGHDFPTGPLDMIQSWVELRVLDAHGQLVFSSGKRDQRNFLEPGTFLFKAEPVDQYGNLIDRHNLWEMVGVRYRRSLFPGYSDTVEYNVMCPSGSPSAPASQAGEERNFLVPVGRAGQILQIEATLHYRKIDQFLLNYVLGEDKHLTAPVVDIASASTKVCVQPAGSTASCE